MGAGDVYEAIKTNVISGMVSGISAVANYKLYEVWVAVTPLYMLNGDEMIVMSKGAYDYLPADMQAVGDQVSADMDAVLTEYTQFEQDGAIKAAKEANPNFKVVDLSSAEEQGFMDAAKAIIEAKAADMDKAGLDGTKALEWLRSKQG